MHTSPRIRSFADVARFALPLLVAGLFVLCGAVGSQAQPPIWDPDYGPEISELAGEDDDVTEVILSFPFRFAGDAYRDIWVGTDGCIQVNGLGASNGIEYYMYEDFGYFFADDDGVGDPEPVICPLNSDFSLFSAGSIHLKDDGTRAVFTWNEVGTHVEVQHSSTFQIQLFADGRIIFGYNGILDEPGEDMVTSLRDGIVVGISLSDGSFPNPADNPFDLSQGSFAAGRTIYERWCGPSADLCDGPTSGPYLGPANSAFDLDQRNILFYPVAGGFEVETSPIFLDGFESGSTDAWQ